MRYALIAAVLGLALDVVLSRNHSLIRAGGNAPSPYIPYFLQPIPYFNGSREEPTSVMK